MRIWLSVLIPLVVGVVVGVATTRAEFAAVEEVFIGVYVGPTVDPLDQLDTPIAEVIDGGQFDFGMMSRNESRIHKFIIKNTGTIQLDVEFRAVSCGKCMYTEFDDEVVVNGETVEIPVRYSTYKPGPGFSEWVEIGTSDPAHAVIRLKVTGKVSEVIRFSDDQLYVDNLTSNQVYTSRFEIYGFHSDELKITDHQWSNSSTAELYDVKFQPIDPAKLTGDPPAKAALEAVVTIQPGLPVGAITQSLEMTAQAGQTIELEMPIAGNVVSDISIGGPANFLRDQNVLDLGAVARDQGESAELQILVKGPNRQIAELRVASVDPENAMKATIGEPKMINSGVVHMYPLVIEIPPGVSAINRRGTAQGKLAKIVIETNLSNAKQVLVYVSFTIE